MQRKNGQSHAIIAALWMSGTLVSFMAMAIGGRQLAGQLTTFQILFFRSFIGLLIIGFLLWRSSWQQIFTKHFKIHAARALAIADAIFVVPLDFLRLPLIAGVGALIYHEPLDWFLLAGGAVMFSGNLINIKAEEKRNKRRKEEISPSGK